MNQLKVGIILNYIIIFINLFVGLLYTPYMLGMMGQSEYGLYSLVASVIAYLTILDLGFGNALIRYTAKFRSEGREREQQEMFGMFLMLYIGIGIVASLIGVGLLHNVDSLFGDTMTAYELERARTMMWLLVANLAITFPMSIFGSIITAYERFVFAKGLNIARLVLNTAVMIALLSFGYKAVAMVVVQTIFNIATLIINLLYCKYRLKIKIILGKIRWELLREVAIYSFWIFINIIIDRIYWSTGQFVLGAKVGTAAVAIFAVAIQLQQMYMAFSTAISGVFLPKVTAMVARGAHNKEISDIFIRVGRIQYIIISLLLYGFMVFGRAFIELWAGEEYSEAFVVTLLFFIGLTIPLIQNMGITILEARNQMRFRSLLYVGIAIISLILQIALASKYGIVGCAIAITGALLLGHGLIMNIYYKSRQHIDILGFWLQIAKMSVAPIAVSIAASYLLCGQDIDSWSELLKYILIYLAAYLPMLYIFSLNTYERGLLKELFMNLKRIVSR
jgi:O-antigen/teichoic acid export membrane protein